MKTISKLLTIAALTASFAACKKSENLDRDIVTGPNPNVDTIKGFISTSVSLSASKTYVLKGLVIVRNGATLTIPAGTRIEGFTAAGEKGTLVIARGSKLIANGLPANPIIFTSNKTSGQAHGDWGGIIILGNAPTNKPTTTAIEGIPNTSDAQYGGNVIADNSGSITYTRIEYAGGVFQGALGSNNEVNGLTFGGVGNGTTVHHVQVSYSGDDSFEFFGGTVSPSYLISYRAIDDDFDFDFGFQGKLQFLVALRDPEINDQSKSNGIECDNDNTGVATNIPRTHPVISNLTILGNNGVADSNPLIPVTSTAGTPGAFQAGAHFRRNTGLEVRNSIFLGYPTAGLLIDGNVTADSLTNGTSQFRYNFVHSNTAGSAFAVASGTTSYTNATLKAFLTNATNLNVELANASDASLVNPFNLSSPVLGQFFISSTTAVTATGANFTGGSFTTGFTSVAYRGAFPPTGGTNGWGGTTWSSF